MNSTITHTYAANGKITCLTRDSLLFNPKDLEAIFQHKIFKMLLSKGKISQDLIRMLRSWRHSGLNVFCGPQIDPRDEKAMENLACYIIRASFSQERMSYLQEEPRLSTNQRMENTRRCSMPWNG